MGLGLWTHLLMVPAISACGLYLLLARPRALFSRLGLALLAGFLLGGLPLWVISLPAGLLRPEVLGAGRPVRPLLAWNQLWAEGLPRVLGLPGRDHLKDSWLAWRLGLWGLYGATLLAAVWPARKISPQPEGGRPGLMALVILYLAVYLTAWVFSGTYNHETWRHLLPFYAGLPFVFGAMVGALRRRSQVLAWTALCLVLGINLWGGLGTAPLLSPTVRQSYESRRQSHESIFNWLIQAGARHGYTQRFWEALPLTLDAAGQVTFCDQVENHLPRLTRLADSARWPVYLTITRSADMKSTLRAARIDYKREELADAHLFHDFSRSWPGLREISPQRWRSPQAGAAETWDRNLTTGWTTAQSQAPGQVLEIDLGREEEGLCLVTLMPGAYLQAALGLEVQLSPDGAQWETVARQNSFSYAPLFWSLDRPLVRFIPARQQLAFAPRAARFLRLLQTGASPDRLWEVAEVFIHQADGPPQPTPQAQELAQAVRELSPHGPIFAPPEVLALLPKSLAGYQDPQLPRPDSFPLEKLAIPLRPETLLCLPRVNWPASLEALEGLLARPPRVVEMGDQVLVVGLEAAPASFRMVDPPSTARLTASHNPDKAGLALDGRATTRWDTGHQQEPGQELALDLGSELEICGLALQTGPWPQDRPRGLKVLVSLNGKDWREPTELELSDPTAAWGGDRVLRGGGTLLARFAPQKVRHARLVQTGSHAHHFWSVAELKLLVPGS
jgi:hypothetical protein